MKPAGAGASPLLRATLFALLSTASFACTGLSVRALTLAGIPTLESAFFRGAISLAMTAPWLMQAGFAGIRTTMPVRHVLRSAANGAGMVLWFAGLGMLALGDALALQFTMPLWVVLAAALFLGEKVDAMRIGVLALGFAGVLIVVRPGAGGETGGIGALLVLGGAAFYALNTIMMKPMSRTESPAAMVFHLNVWYVPAFGACLPFVWVAPGWEHVLWLALLGIAGASAHFFLTRALALADASYVSPFEFLKLPFGAGLAFLLFGDVSDLWTWVGAAVIFAAGLLNARHEGTRRRRAGGDGA
jgi:drug/metabolite transporter (DMT)-like permease